MGRVSRDARLLFVLLWTQCDDFGRFRANSRMLASLLFPYDGDISTQIEVWLQELIREKCLYLYEAEGNHYLQVVNWHKHQRVDHPSGAMYPDPRENSREFASVPVTLAPSRARADRDRDRDRDAIPLPSSNLKESSLNGEVVEKLNEVVSGISGTNGNHYRAQQSRDEFATTKIAEVIGWPTMMAAEDISDPNHHKAVTAALAASKRIRVGWVSPERRRLNEQSLANGTIVSEQTAPRDDPPKNGSRRVSEPKRRGS